MINWIIENKEWLFSGAGIFLLTAIIGIIKMKNKTDKPENETSSSVDISGAANISGNVAGRDIVINTSNIDDRVDEFVSIFKLRAECIRNQLKEHYKHAPVQEYLDKFEKLHVQHIDALEKHNFLLAHEFLMSICRLSYSLEKNELWSRNGLNAPYINLSAMPDILLKRRHLPDIPQPGRLICAYITGEMTPNSNRYPSDENTVSNIENAKSFYAKILENTKR